MKKYLAYILYFANLIALIGLWWWLSFSQTITSEPAFIAIEIGKLAGILATYQALVQLVLIGRTKWIEQFFGLDRLSRLHKWNGYAVLILILSHIFFVTNGHGTLNEISHLDQYLNFIKNWDDIFKAFLAYMIILGTVVLSVTIVRKKLKYEWWYWVHLLNYLAYVLFVGHQLEYGLSNSSTLFAVYWAGLYIFAFGNIGLYRFFLPLYKFYKHQFTISKVTPVGDGLATSVYIEGKNLENLNVQAGQFFILRFLQKGFWYEAHPFSLSVAPNTIHLRITAKNLGDYTSKINQLSPGTKVLIDGPHGVFTASKAIKNKFLLLAGGIGITPLRSLAEELSKQKQDITLIYGAKNKDELLLLDELKTLKEQNPNFKLVTCLSDQEHPDHETGYIDAALIKKHTPDYQDRDVYLCGPPVMMNILRKTLLTELKLPKKQFHWERFAL